MTPGKCILLKTSRNSCSESIGSAWDEIYEVFGDGHEYDWALDEDDAVVVEEQTKPDMKYEDVSLSPQLLTP